MSGLGCGFFLGLLFLYLGCLLYACITDLATGYVYHFVWWIAWGAGTMMLIATWLERGRPEHLGALVFYGLLQEIGFARCYGRADCHAFLSCAIVECAFGMGWTEYLVQMLIAFGALGIVQASRRNIDRKGNLKVPVPFLPYITGSFIALYVIHPT